MARLPLFPKQPRGEDDHDRGLAHDIETLRHLDRRRALGLVGLGGSALALGSCGGGSSGGTGIAPTPSPAPSPTPAPPPQPSPTPAPPPGPRPTVCTAYASETSGPFPADGTNTSSGPTSNVLPDMRFQRSDIRSSVIGSPATIASGVDLRLTLRLANVNDSCAPLSGYAVYVWHCNAMGQYSLYDLPQESYLRGVQVSDANGEVRFTTIVPGCYTGRYPHLHIEVFSSLANATSGRFAVLVSQLVIPPAVCQAVYARSGYGQSQTRFNATSIAGDSVFGDNTAAQIAAMTPATSGSVAAGYDATAVVGLAT